MNRFLSTYSGRQRGWSLLEAAVVAALLGIMGVAIWTTIQTLQRQENAAQARPFLERAENAVYGSTLTHFHFPLPEEAAPSAGRPGFVEGWLPASLLGVPTSRRTRYLVDVALVDTPSAIYKPDPFQLAGGLIEARSTVNGLDFCLALIKQERAKLTTLPGGMRLGFALQEAGTAENAGAFKQIWVGDSVAGPPPVNAELNTRTQGYTEAAAKLGCFEKLARISGGVKATAVTVDLVKLAQQNVKFRELEVKRSSEDVVNIKWRIASRSTMAAHYAFNIVATVIQIQNTTPLAIPLALAQLSVLGTAMAGTDDILNVARLALSEAQEQEKVAKDNLTAALLHLGGLKALRQSTAARTNQLQNAGLNP